MWLAGWLAGWRLVGQRENRTATAADNGNRTPTGAR